ncbi:MAG TPA: UDP-N-acetylglucosamine 1-carboxyvinyltransferase [Candidatus Aphodomonas merdavium]|nr:UDP-N-acetylglucosamine 1-carboxyvinyltransferase [Candidatus Aphodomonas merdavium]
MRMLRVEGGRRLSGETRVSRAKNAVLPILAASLLTDGEVTVKDVPRIDDVAHMLDILRTLGCDAVWDQGDVRLSAANLRDTALPDALAKTLRSSIFLMGPLLARMRRAAVTYPGGCEIGLRPIDLHLQGLRALGVAIREEGGLILCDGSRMHGSNVHFDYPSVGATENVMLAAVLAPGDTTIYNAAREPEIADLQACVNKMGGRVRGAGTSTIEIEGVAALHGVCHRPIPDRIVAGTLLAALAITGGEGRLLETAPREMSAVLEALREMGCRVHVGRDSVALRAPERLRAFRSLQTSPHPGFPTDMQAQMLALASIAQGTSVLTENVFENRLNHVQDLRRMGADIVVSGRVAVVRGVEKLSGARVSAHDLRAGAALVLAGLCAQGETVVEHAERIDRGYERLEEQLGALGALVSKETDETV